ncbi:Amino-acid carrier protein AlsT [compost metagenome]
MGDIGVGLMAWLNIGAILLLQKTALVCLKDYEAQQAQGLDPVFHPEKLGIKNADYWAGHRSEDNLEQEQSGHAFEPDRKVS